MAPVGFWIAAVAVRTPGISEYLRGRMVFISCSLVAALPAFVQPTGRARERRRGRAKPCSPLKSTKCTDARPIRDSIPDRETLRYIRRPGPKIGPTPE